MSAMKLAFFWMLGVATGVWLAVGVLAIRGALW